MKNVAVVGSGAVGEALANGFLKHGYEVMRASRNPDKLNDWKGGAGPRAQVGDLAAAVKFADTVMLAVKGTGAEEAVGLLGADALAGKIVIDATNPIADEPPQNGILRFFTSGSDSLMERLQRKAPRARFVKAFSCVGNALMVNPAFDGTRPTMFICGADPSAKTEVTQLLDQFGWDVEDVGSTEAARAIEPLCILWCARGFLKNQWMHAFKLLKK